MMPKVRIIIRSALYFILIISLGYTWGIIPIYLSIIGLALSGFVLNDNEINQKANVNWMVYAIIIIVGIAVVSLCPFDDFNDNTAFRIALYGYLGINGVVVNYFRYKSFIKNVGLG